MKKITRLNCLSSQSLFKNLLLLGLGALVASCSPSGGDQPAKIDRSSAVILTGSNTIGEELAPRLIAQYKKDHPGVAFETEFKGTSYGVGSLLSGMSDIAGASRVMTSNEVELARLRNIDCNDYVIGAYSVAVVVNAGNSLGNLTREQVRDIFTGVIQNWKDVGGSDAPIHLYIRDPISGTHLGFRELAMENKPYGAGLKPFTSYSAIIEAVANDPNGIGYSGMDLLTKPGIKAVSIGGVAPTAATVNQGQYPYARVLHLFTDKAKEPAAAHEFVQFIQSSSGQEVLNQMGFVPKS